jgi:radical SAM superfamily enzyme YgiQ (UPF0313 family)
MKYKILIFSDMDTYGFSRTAGPYRIATHLTENGYPTKVIPILKSISVEEIKEIIYNLSDDNLIYVGISTNFLYSGAVQKLKDSGVNSTDDTVKINYWCHYEEYWIMLRQWISKNFKKAKLVVGGHQAWGRKELFDYCIIGYGEEKSLALAKAIENEDFSDFSVSGNNLVTLKKSAIQKYSYDFSKTTIFYDYIGINNEIVPVEISRGCIFKCAFCSYPLNGKKKLDYIKDMDVLKNEFLDNHRRLGSKKFIFMDDTFNDTTYKIENLKRNVLDKLPFHMQFQSYFRLDLLHRFPEQISLLEGHVDSVFFGIETMSKQNGKVIGKSLDFQKQIETAWNIKQKWNCHIMIGLIVGLPYDTDNTIEDMITFLNSNENPFDGWSVSPLSINFFSDKQNKSLFQLNPEKYGYIGVPNTNNWYNTINKMDYNYAIAKSSYILKMTEHKNQYGIFINSGLRNLGISDEYIKNNPLKTDLDKMGLSDKLDNLYKIIKKNI